MSDILFVIVEYLLKPPFKFFVAFNPTVEDGAVGCKEKYAKVNFRNRNYQMKGSIYIGMQ